MMMRAYDEDYVTYAQRILGDMLDFAVNTLEFDADEFFTMFQISGMAYQFERGNPSYVAGKTGCELAREVLRESGLGEPEKPDVMYLDKSPEYWAGWALAFYQWYTGRTFKRIHRAVSIDTILCMYAALHEADIMKFVSVMDEKLQEYYTDTNLRRLRGFAGMSQEELAERSGIALAEIQLWETGVKDIQKARAGSVWRLARALSCTCEDLLEL